MNNAIKNMTQLDVTALRPSSTHAVSLGGTLLELGKLSHNDIDRVLRLQAESGLRFGEAAVSLNLATDADIQQALARQFNYPYLQPGEKFCSPELVVAYEPFCAASEVFRSVRSQLLLRWFRHGKKELVVISDSGEEQASMFTANLAIVFSQLGRSTLLVDANLRNGRHQSLFGLPGLRGLSDILACRAGIEQIFNMKPFPELSILAAGTRPPNSTELLSRPTFSQLRSELCPRYDVMLYDVPAFSDVNDALTVAVEVGAALLLVKRNIARADHVSAMSRQLQESGVMVVGSVLI